MWLRRALLCATALLVACQSGTMPTAPNASASASSSPGPSRLSSALVFEVAPGQGTATIRIREQLISWTAPDDAVLTSDAVIGQVGLRDDGSIDPASLVTVELRTLRSDDSRRADAARETMNADRFPQVEFRPRRTEGLPAPLAAAGRWEFRLIGSLRVNGVERETVWEASAERAAGVLRISARTKFQFGDFAMDLPRRGPVLSLVDEIRLQIDAEAREVGSPCVPTTQDVPANYKPNAPRRSSIGTGYVFGGVVRSAAACDPIAGASVEIWLANPAGVYDDDHRATLTSDERGRYRLETSLPPAYGGGESHVHIRVSAPGHRTLVAMFFPKIGTVEGAMDLVLERP